MHRDHRHSEPQHSEHEKQRRRDRGGNQQRSETPDMLRSAYGYRPGRSTTLITPSSLSRNFLYIAGASSRLAGCVTTKLGSILPSSKEHRLIDRWVSCLHGLCIVPNPCSEQMQSCFELKILNEHRSQSQPHITTGPCKDLIDCDFIRIFIHAASPSDPHRIEPKRHLIIDGQFFARLDGALRKDINE